MKKNLLLFFFSLSLITTTRGQNALPNGNFESWTSSTYNVPKYSVLTSNPDVFFAGGSNFNCEKVTDAYHGTYAIKLTTAVITPGDTSGGYFVNGNANGNPSSWTGGIPITQSPTGIKGYYKSTMSGNDSGLIILSFRKAGSNIGVYAFKLSGTHSSYTSFSFTLSPALPVTPDSVVMGATSSDLLNGVAILGSVLQLDSLSFTGISAQPAEMNGDFESWLSVTVSKPDNWYAISSDQQKGVKQSNDAYQGNYAIELITLATDGNNGPLAIASQISTAYYACPSGGGQCGEVGGTPFHGMIDTLAFYYKYIPSGGDNALVNLNFKQNGLSIGGGMANLNSSSNYQYIEIPVSLGLQPDTAVVQFLSSLYEDTSITFAGSDLKVDDVHFKSQVITGTDKIESEKRLSIYPNPSGNGSFMVRGVNAGEQVRILNVLGEEVKAIITTGKNSSVVQLADYTSGIYFVQVTSKDKILTCKVSVSGQP